MNRNKLINACNLLSYQIEVFKVTHLRYKKSRKYKQMLNRLNEMINQLEETE